MKITRLFKNAFLSCSNTFEEIMEDDTAEFDTFARQIEEMTKSTTTDYSEEREFGHLPPLKSSR